jgi:predicted lipid-binding transport protein (Tim44 family)
MKLATTALIAVLLLALSAGCERRKPESNRPYDPKLDAPASVVRVTPDPSVLEDQSRIAAAERSRRTRAAAVEAGAATPAAPEPGAPEAPTAGR